MKKGTIFIYIHPKVVSEYALNNVLLKLSSDFKIIIFGLPKDVNSGQYIFRKLMIKHNLDFNEIVCYKTTSMRYAINSKYLNIAKRLKGRSYFRSLLNVQNKLNNFVGFLLLKHESNIFIKSDAIIHAMSVAAKKYNVDLEVTNI